MQNSFSVKSDPVQANVPNEPRCQPAAPRHSENRQQWPVESAARTLIVRRRLPPSVRAEQLTERQASIVRMWGAEATSAELIEA